MSGVFKQTVRIVNQRGLFCVIEGIDGSGKSTLCKNLMNAFAHGVTEFPSSLHVLHLREPTGGPTGQKIREYLSSQAEHPAEEWLHLFIDDRRENVHFYIEPALARGRLIIQDRYFYSTAAYQGGLPGGFTPEQIIEKNRSEGFPEPDLILYIDISPDEALKRLKGSRESLETFETLPRLTRIHDNYDRILPANAVRLSGMLSENKLLELALGEIKSRIKSM